MYFYPTVVNERAPILSKKYMFLKYKVFNAECATFNQVTYEGTLFFVVFFVTLQSGIQIPAYSLGNIFAQSLILDRMFFLRVAEVRYSSLREDQRRRHCQIPPCPPIMLHSIYFVMYGKW